MNIKICTHCKKIKLLAEFCKNKTEPSGYSCWCKDCQHNYYLKRKTQNKTQHYKVRKECTDRYNLKNPEKRKCRGILFDKIRRGIIKKRNICEMCYNSPTECHHEDYNKPLDFIELCRSCHVLLHNQYRQQLT